MSDGSETRYVGVILRADLLDRLALLAGDPQEAWEPLAQESPAECPRCGNNRREFRLRPDFGDLPHDEEDMPLICRECRKEAGE